MRSECSPTPACDFKATNVDKEDVDTDNYGESKKKIKKKNYGSIDERRGRKRPSLSLSMSDGVWKVDVRRRGQIAKRR